MARSSKYTVIVNVFGALGYISLVFQWGWTSLVLAYPIFVTRPDFFFPKQQAPRVEPVAIDAQFSPLLIAIAVIVTIVVMLATIVTIARLPKTIGRQGAKLTHSTARSIMPTLTHHKKLTATQRTRLSYRVVLLLKLALIVAPLALLCLAQPIEHVPASAVWLIALFCAACTVVYFAVQQLIVHLLRVDTKAVW